MIRHVKHEDKPAVLGLLAQARAEFPTEAPPIDAEQAIFVLSALINDPEHVHFDVCERGGEVVGVLVAERRPDLWSGVMQVFTHLFYVSKEHRNGTAAARLFEAFETWAGEQPASVRFEVANVSKHALAGALQRRGYSDAAAVYTKEVA